MPVLGSKVFNLNDDMNIDDDDDEDEKQPLAVVKQRYSQSDSPSPSKAGSERTPGPEKKTPRAVVARPPTSHGSKKKKTPLSKPKRKPPVLIIDDSSSDDEVVLSKIVSPKNLKASSLATTPKKNNATPSASSKTPKSKTPNTKPRSAATNSSPRNPFSSPNKLKQKRFQVFCNKLEKLWEAKSKQQTQNATQKAKKEYNSYAHVVVTTLQRSEIERIPDAAIRADVLKRYETHMDRKKMQSMTEEERTQYLKEKYAAQRKQQKEKEQNERKRYEDTSVESQPLLSPRPVTIPDGFVDCNYGDVLMVINFIRSYSALLMPKEDVRLIPEEFASALVDAENGYPYLAKVLLVLLHTLIHDEEAAFLKEMGVRLTDLELNSSTVGELVRLCLRKQHEDGEGDDDEEKSKSSYESITQPVVDEEILEEISGTDFADLLPSKKLKLLVALCSRLLSSVAVENYLIDVQQQFADAIMERNAAAHECNKLNKETKQEQGSKPPTPAPTPAAMEEPAGDEEEDIASKVKRRRLMAEEKAKRDAEERVAEEKRKEKEFIEYKAHNRLDAANRKLDDITALKKAVLHVEPLGTDRHHSRYWYFGKWLPAVFVEKGWTSVDDPADGTQADQSGSAREAFVETTFPKRSSNEWFCYENVEDLETLLKTLCTRGIRESKLKERLEASVSEIKAVKEKENGKSTAASVAVKDYAPLPEDFVSKLVQLESSVRMGGLGGVADFTEWKKALESCTNLMEMGAKLIEVSSHVRPTLLCGVLAPEVKKGETDEQDAKSSTAVYRWREAVRQCRTWGRLHVLMSMLRSCIRWDRSVEHAKCRICRKKQDDDLALVCDNCNDIYHTYCLRPPLKKLPVGEWFCMSCKPRPPPRAAKELRRNIYVDEDEDEEDEESDGQQGQENGDEERNENCIVCGEGEFEDQSDELIVCTECSTAFHLNCHNPPLRHRPRSAWRCSQCVSGRKIRSARLRSKMGREYNKPGHSYVTKASANLYTDSDLFDDEVSSAESGSVSSEKRGKRS